MANFKRFMWVRSPRAGRLHIKYGAASEGPAKCGTFVRKGWHIVSRTGRPILCKRCMQ